jgi:hypothetical protein
LERDCLGLIRHCEERSDAAIQSAAVEPLDCFASLAMTEAVRSEAVAL